MKNERSGAQPHEAWERPSSWFTEVEQELAEVEQKLFEIRCAEFVAEGEDEAQLWDAARLWAVHARLHAEWLAVSTWELEPGAGHPQSSTRGGWDDTFWVRFGAAHGTLQREAARRGLKLPRI
jgi:hypothetical protein